MSTDVTEKDPSGGDDPGEIPYAASDDMDEQHKQLLDQYYRGADEWERDRATERRRTLWVSLGYGLLMTLTTIASLWFAVNRPAQVKYVPMLVRATPEGGFELPVVIDEKTLTAKEEFHYIWQYLQNCEGYASYLFGYQHSVCMSMTSPDAAVRIDQIRALFDYKDKEKYPDSYYARFGHEGTIGLEYQASTMLGKPEDRVIQVRYIRTERKTASTTPVRTFWVATIEYKFIPGTKVPENYQIFNPVGMLVTGFTTTKDVSSGVR